MPNLSSDLDDFRSLLLARKEAMGLSYRDIERRVTRSRETIRLVLTDADSLLPIDRKAVLEEVAEALEAVAPSTDRSDLD